MSGLSPEYLIQRELRRIHWYRPEPRQRTEWRLRRCRRLGFYTGEDWRAVLRIRWGRDGTYERVFWRVFWGRA